MAILGIVVIAVAVVLAAIFLGPTARGLGAQTRERRDEKRDGPSG